MEVAIVGAGISGILTALHLTKNKKINSISVFERKSQNLIPRKHCSGIVSRTTLLSIPYSSKFTENTYSYVDIFVGSNFEVELVFDKDAIHKIDRVAHERFLIDIIRSKGVDVRFDVNVTDIKTEGRGYRIKAVNELGTLYNCVIISEGYPSRLSHKLGLKAYAEPFKGIQQELHLEKRFRVEYLDRLVVYLESGGEFAWLIPINERKIIIGVASKGYSMLKLDLYKKLFIKKLGLEISRIEDTFGGVILRGYPQEIIRGGVLGIGDAVSTVKSFSGGGLYPISTISRIYGENIHQIPTVKYKVRVLVDELKKQFMLYNIIRRFLGNTLSKKLLRRGISIKVKNDYFYDHHEKILAKVFTNTILA